MVLREVDADQRCLLFYSDQRAGKVAQLLSHPEGTLVMWSATLAWQLRCRVQLSLEPPGPATSSRWACIQMSPSAQDYLSPLPPGAPLGDEPAADTAHSSRGHFAVIRAQVTALDWLELHRDGHRRALFSPFGNQHGDANVGRWVQP